MLVDSRHFKLPGRLPPLPAVFPSSGMLDAAQGRLIAAASVPFALNSNDVFHGIVPCSLRDFLLLTRKYE
jgi:hypothetical protein